MKTLRERKIKFSKDVEKYADQYAKIFVGKQDLTIIFAKLIALKAIIRSVEKPLRREDREMVESAVRDVQISSMSMIAPKNAEIGLEDLR